LHACTFLDEKKANMRLSEQSWQGSDPPSPKPKKHRIAVAPLGKAPMIGRKKIMMKDSRRGGTTKNAWWRICRKDCSIKARPSHTGSKTPLVPLKYHSVFHAV
jgi:hypothetical protein